MRPAVLTLAFAVPALAHPGEPLAPHDLWTAWVLNPGVTLPLLVSGFLYARGADPARGNPSWRAACFWSGWVLLSLALVSPLHAAGEVLFSAHMIQHEILMLAAAPLLVISRPLAPLLWGLPMEWRKAAGRWTRLPAWQRIWTAITFPLAAWWIHAAALWIWHVPAFFEATLTSEWMHAAQHASFFGSALLFWWSLFYSRGHAAYGLAVLYIFTTAVHTSILGALLTLSPVVWYSRYGAGLEQWGLTPLEDQQLGGLIMWVPGGVFYLVAGLACFEAWLRRSSAAARTASLAIVMTVLVSGCRREPAGRGIPGAQGNVGPPLSGLGDRLYVAGMLANTHDNLSRWVQGPKGNQRTDSHAESRASPSGRGDISAYLFSLK